MKWKRFIWRDNFARTPSPGAQIKKHYTQAKNYAAKGVIIVYKRKRRKRDTEYEPSAI